MNNLHKIVLAICLLFAVSNIQAQIKFGPVAGLNLSTMTIKVLGLNFDSETVVGFHAGVISEIPVNENFVLQPAVLYTTKGADYTVIGEEIALRPSFIEIPVNILYKYDVGPVKLFLKAGPFIAYGIGGQIESNGIEVDIDYGSGNADMKPFDFGLNFGAGVDFNNFLLSGQYGVGLANLTSIEAGNAEMKINVIGISLAYLFGN
ncbi:MAG: PorT family protein [Bacteroidales bacterium]|nr:PorT family protein [Bacteroidales bacterium]